MVLDFISQGGPMMIPLLACSIWAVYIILWKSISLLRHPLRNPVYYERIQNVVLTQGREAALQSLQLSRSLSDQLTSAVISASEMTREDAHDSLQAAQEQVAVELERGLSVLHSMISIAPMIGLLGTVLGLMDIFKGISAAVSGDITVMYAGISVALINTVFGLAVAIPCAFFYQFFSQRVDLASSKISLHLVSLLQFCRQRGR